MSPHNSRHGTTCSISSRNTCRRVFFVYRSKPFIVARLLCCLFVDLIWRNLLYIPVERETLFRVSLVSLPLWILLRRHHLAIPHVNDAISITSGFRFVGDHEYSLSQLLV